VVRAFLSNHIVDRFKVVQTSAGACKYINVKDKQGRTALHIAAFKTNENLTKTLVDYGADPTIEDNSGQKPSLLAHKTGRRKSKEMLDAACTKAEAEGGV
jgi:ankyrin repeat protein